MDVLPALALAVPPTPPAPGKGSSSNETPAEIAGNDFAAHMVRTDTWTGGREQAAPPSGASWSSGRPVDSESGDGAARERPAGPVAPDPEVAVRRPDQAHRTAAEQVQTIAEATMGDVPSIGPSGGGQAAAIAPEIAAARVEPKMTDRPDAGHAETSVVETEPGPARPIPTAAPDQLPSPSDAPAETGLDDAAQTARRQADPALSDGGAATPASAVTSDTGFTIARQSPPPALESEIARGDRNAAGPAALPAALSSTAPSGATGRSGEHPTPSGGDPITRAVEPRRALAPADGAEGDDRGLRQEGTAAQDGPLGSQVRGTDPSARQQPSSDLQPGRLTQVSGLHGNVVAGPHPATGVGGEVAQLSARASDGAVSIEPGAHPATRQVALHITKALDRDRTEIRIRLDPPELGEVDIQLEFRDLRLSASVSAERPDTLELLQRDSRSLARALREAGLELADSDLSFAHNGRNHRPDAGSYPQQRAINLPHPLSVAARLQDLSMALAGPGGLVSLSDGRIDLRV